MSFYGKDKGADTNFRKTWDLDEVRRRAAERELADRDKSKNDERRDLGLRPLKKKDGEPAEERSLLKAREDAIDFSAVVNSTKVVNVAGGEQAGFVCKVCNTVAKDNASFLDHINGRKHQRNLGMSLKVERSTAEQVKARLESISKRKAEGEPEYDLSAKVKKAKEEEAERKQAKKEEKRRRKESSRREKDGGGGGGGDDAASGAGMDPEMAAMMGFTGFGGSKKNN